jgi:hypothetical protein
MTQIKPLLSINLSTTSFFYKAYGLLNLCFVVKFPSLPEIHLATWNSTSGFISIVQLQQTSMANLRKLLQLKFRSLTGNTDPGNRNGLLSSAHKFKSTSGDSTWEALTVVEGKEHVFKMAVSDMCSWLWSLQLFMFILDEANLFAMSTEINFEKSLEQVIGYIMGFIVTKLGWGEVPNGCEECFLVRVKNMGRKQGKLVCNEHNGIIVRSGSFKRFFSNQKAQILFSDIWSKLSSLLDIPYSEGYQSYQNQYDEIYSVDLNVNLIAYVMYNLDMVPIQCDKYRLSQFSSIMMVIDKERESLDYVSDKRNNEWELSEKKTKKSKYSK